jgi:hypothetical protein
MDPLVSNDKSHRGPPLFAGAWVFLASRLASYAAGQQCESSCVLRATGRRDEVEGHATRIAPGGSDGPVG